MVRRLWNIGLILLATVSTAAGQTVGVVPPTQQLIRVNASGEMRIYYQVTVCVAEMRTRTVQVKRPVTKEVQYDVNGETRTKTVTEYAIEEVTQPYTVMIPRSETRMRTAKLDKLKAFEIDGKPIPVKKLKERLTEDTLAVVSADGKMIADYYAALFKPGTIILAFDQEAAPPPPAEEGAPPPPPTSGLPAPVRFVSQQSDNEAVQIRIPEATPAPAFPKSMPPVFVFAGRDGSDSYKLRQTTEHSFEVKAFKAKKSGGGQRMIPVTMTQTVRHSETTTIAGKDLEFFAGDGAALSPERVKEKLSREGTVVYSTEGGPVDPFWLQNLKKTTLVLVGPQLPGGCSAPMMGSVVAAAPVAAPAPPPATETPPPPPAAPAPAAPPTAPAPAPRAPQLLRPKEPAKPEDIKGELAIGPSTVESGASIAPGDNFVVEFNYTTETPDQTTVAIEAIVGGKPHPLFGHQPFGMTEKAGKGNVKISYFGGNDLIVEEFKIFLWPSSGAPGRRDVATVRPKLRFIGNGDKAGLAPLVMAAQVSGKDSDQVVFLTHVVKPVAVEEDGQKTVKQVKELHATATLFINDVRAYDSDGNPIEASELPKLLEKPTPVVVFQADPPDPAYLPLLKEGGIALVATPGTFDPPPPRPYLSAPPPPPSK